RVICEYQAYIEPRLTAIASGVFQGNADLSGDEITDALHAVANEARTIEGRLSKSDWIVGDACSAVDMVIFPGIQLLTRALERPGRLLFVGFGSIGQGVLPLSLRHIGSAPERLTIVTAEDKGNEEAARYGVKFVKERLTRENYRRVLNPLLGRGDFLINVSV